MSQIVIQNRETLPPAVAQELDAWAACLNARFTSIETDVSVLGWFNVSDYSAVADGATDNWLAFQTAINAANTAGGGVVYVPKGQFWIGAELTLYENVWLRGCGRDLTTLLFSSSTTACGLKATAANAGYVALDANVAEGDRTFTVTTGGGASFSVGDWCYLQDASTQYGSFISRVLSVTGDVVTMEDDSPVAITAATTGRAYYAGGNYLTGIGVCDLTLKAASNRSNLLSLTRCVSPQIRRCGFEGGTASHILLNGCYGAQIDGNVAEQTANNYAFVEPQASTHTSITNNILRELSFGIVTAHCPYTKVIGNTVTGRNAAAANGRGIKIADNSNRSVISGNTVSNTYYSAIYIDDSSSCTVTGNVISGTGADAAHFGISVGGDVEALCHHNVVTGNRIDKCGGYGINVGGTSGGASVLVNLITGNLIRDCYGGMYVVSSGNRIAENIIDGTTTGGGIVVNDAAATTNVIEGNHFLNITGYAINTSVGSGGNIIRQNDLNGEPINTDALDLIYNDPGQMSSCLGIRTTIMANVTGDATVATVTYDSETYDTLADFDPTTGIFTARYTGVYTVSGAVTLAGILAAHDRYDVTLAHKNSGGSTVATYPVLGNPYAMMYAGYLSVPIAVSVRLTLGDTLYLSVNVNGGTKVVDIYGAAGTTIYTWLSVSQVQ